MKNIWASMDAGEVVVGHWVASASPVIVELIGYSHTAASWMRASGPHTPAISLPSFDSARTTARRFPAPRTLARWE